MTRPDSAARRALRLRRIRITGWSALTSLLVTIVSFAVWAYTPYPADREAVAAVYARTDISVNSDPDLVVMSPVDDTGELIGQALVFYPGARVDPHAYAATFADFVADTGMTVVIPRPPLNLALADVRGAHQLRDLAPDTLVTALGGHSLGGVKACQMAPTLGVDSLILFASYCASDISDTSIAVLSLLGDQDGLTDASALERARELLPTGAEHRQLAGFNHALFGDYGPQRGDNLATISRAEAMEQITAILVGVLTAEDD